MSARIVRWFERVVATGGAATIFELPAVSGLAVRDIVFVNSSGQAEKADQSNTAKMPALGMVTEMLPSTVKVTSVGLVDGFTGLTPGDTLYLDANGGYVTTEPSTRWSQKVGTAVSATEAWIFCTPYATPVELTPPISFLNDKSVVFDGVDDFIIVGDVPELQFDRTDAFSVSVWFKKSTTITRLFFAKRERQLSSPYIYKGYSLVFRSTDIKFDLCSDDSTVPDVKIDVRADGSTAAYSDGGWHHVVVTYDGSSSAAGCKIYMDAVALAMTTYTDNLTGTILNTMPFLWGARGDGVSTTSQFWDGHQDEGSVWNKELSQAEVTEIYNAGSPTDLLSHSAASNLVHWLRMGDNDTFPTLTDNSTNTNDGTMTNMDSGDIVTDAP